MKNGPFTPRPGEFFRWYCVGTDNLCYLGEDFWSTPMKCWVPCRGINLLISFTDTDMWWLNNNRLIHAFVDDFSVPSRIRSIYPRSGMVLV